MKESTIRIIKYAMPPLGIVVFYTILELADSGSKKSLDKLLLQQIHTSTTTISAISEGIPSIDEITQLYEKVEKTPKETERLKSLLERLVEIEEKKGNYENVIDNKLRLAQVYEVEGMSTKDYNNSIMAYIGIINLTKEHKIKKKKFINDLYLKIGDLCMNSENINPCIIKEVIFAYLKGIFEEGDKKETIVERINRLGEKYKADVTMAVKEFYDQTNPNQKKILIEALPKYKYLEDMSKKYENKRNWKYALQEYTHQTMTALRTQNMRSLRARTQNIRLRA